MTDEEQEALSHKYLAWRIVPLSSGRVALFDDGLHLRSIDFWTKLEVPTSDEILALYATATRNEIRHYKRPSIAKPTISDLDF